MKLALKTGFLVFLCFVIFTACREKQKAPSKELIDQLHLRSGEIISCGAPGKEFGVVNFPTSCGEAVRNDFNVALELLHSFEYDEAEKVFAKIVDKNTKCAMAYWGIAMCSVHPLWEPPTEADLRKGMMAIEIAKTISAQSERESDYVNAIAAYYNDWRTTSPHARSINFEKAMERVYKKYPDDKEAAVFYALALDASAEVMDKSYSNQKKAGAILNDLYGKEPNHPGIIHYIIHTYDYPGIAYMGLAAAKRYADVAPSSAHALHMPSHIFTRLGMWDDCISSNKKSVSAAQCYAQSAGIKGHWDEELHGLDYLLYAYLQKGDNKNANGQLQYISSITDVYPVDFKVAYAFAAAPTRMALENKEWEQAATIQLTPAIFPWRQFPWQEAIVHFGRLLGAVHTGKLSMAQFELKKLIALGDTLQKQNDTYKFRQVAIQIEAGKAWIEFLKGNKTVAENIMSMAADMEDSTSKHPVTPGEVLPARELYADMLFQMTRYDKALYNYELVLKKSPNRFNSLYGAGIAAEKATKMDRAKMYYQQLILIADKNSERPELRTARSFLDRHSQEISK